MLISLSTSLHNKSFVTSRKLERAEQLITGFGGEREKWAEMSQKLETHYVQLTGDVLFAAGTVAYLGAFPEKERQKQIVNW